MEQTPTFVFGDDGVAYLYQGTKIIASSRNLDELEKLAVDYAGTQFGQPDIGMTDPLTQSTNAPCMQCGGAGCPACQGVQAPSNTGVGSPMQPMAPMAPMSAAKDPKEEREEEITHRLESDDPENDNPLPIDKATHVITPNGIEAKIVGRAKSLWGEEITLRLANGRIARYDVVGGEKYESRSDDTRLSAYQKLQARLDEVPVMNKVGLLNRIGELKAIRKEAQSLASSAPYLDAQALDEIVLTATHEMREAAQAIDYIEANGLEAPTPFTHQAVEQPSFGGDASWLQDVMDGVLGEAQATDYDRLMDEAPETLIAEIETPVLSDQEAVSDIANDFVTSKTVGLNPEAVEAFREAFLARVNEVRVKEASTRYETNQEKTASQKKTAKVLTDEANNTPDEGLFL